MASNTFVLKLLVYLLNKTIRMLAASMECWRMVRALRSHGRCWLVVSSDEMSPYASRSRTYSVTDRRLITDLSTAPYDQKDLCVSCRTYTSVESLATKHGWTSQTAESVDNRFSPRYNRFIYFPQTSNSSATTTRCKQASEATYRCHRLEAIYITIF